MAAFVHLGERLAAGLADPTEVCLVPEFSWPTIT